MNIENPISELATILKDNETKLGLFDEIFSTYNDYTVSAKYLFDVLNGKNLSDFEELEVLDLFSGTGSISYEFASRGVQKVISVEMKIS